MPTKNSTARGIRLPDENYALIMDRANRRGWTFNRWINWAIVNGLRSHKKKDGGLETLS